MASFAAVVGIPLAGFTVVGVWYAADEYRNALVDLQRTHAEAAAFRITQFANEIEGQLRWLTHLAWAERDPEQHRLDALRLLRQTPAVTELALLDGDGRERLFVSRVSMDRADAGADRSGEAAFRVARASGEYYGPVYFRRDTEPFMTVALAGTRPEAGVVIAEVNLAYVHEVVSQVRVGVGGQAYAVDRAGRLIAHPDASLVLRNTDLSATTQRIDASPEVPLHRTTSLQGEPVLIAQAAAPPLDWRVLVELPQSEADAPWRRALDRALWVTALSLAAALAAAAAFSWRMVRPIRALTAGAARIGAGRLDHRIEIDSADEIEQLGHQFNTMAGELERSYATLEHTVQVRTRALTEANQAKSRFLAAASHDLRQPLHALNLLVAQLRAESLPAERERLTGRIEHAVGSINGLFDGLLDISKLDAGVVAAKVSAIPLQSVLDRVDATFAQAARARGLRLHVRAHDAWVRSDPVLLQRVVDNLVANALRYTRHGGVVVGCRRRAGTVRLEVWDSGIGIPADQHQAIFGEFYQLAPTATLRGEGLGLGLAIVARLAGLLDHRIDVASRPGRGSRFGVVLAEVEPQPLAAPKDAQVADPVDVMHGARLLVIDNDNEVLESTAGLLRAWGGEVVTARSVSDALARLGSVAPALVIVDMHLDDGEDGLQAAARLRERFGAGTPVIVVSGDVSASTRDRIAALGLPLLEKPVSPLRLRTWVIRSMRATRPPGAGSSPGA